MSFKGEIALGALNSKYKYGFTVGDIYRVQGAGNLVPNNLAVANGAFVEWKSTGWEVKKDMQYATSKTGESLDQAVADVLDDHATSSAEEYLTMPAAEAANYTVDNYFEQDGEIWKCTAKTDNGDGTWTIEADKVNGVVPVLNELVNAPPKGRTEYTLDVTITNDFTPGIPIEANSMTYLNVNCTNTGDKSANIIVKPDSFIRVLKTGHFYYVDFQIGRLVNNVFTTINRVVIAPDEVSFDGDIKTVLTSSGHGLPTSFDDLKEIDVCGSDADISTAQYTMKSVEEFIIHVVSETFAVVYIVP